MAKPSMCLLQDMSFSNLLTISNCYQSVLPVMRGSGMAIIRIKGTHPERIKPECFMRDLCNNNKRVL